MPYFGGGGGVTHYVFLFTKSINSLDFVGCPQNNHTTHIYIYISLLKLTETRY